VFASLREKQVAAQWEQTQKDWLAENAKHPETNPRNPENAARVKAALDIAGADVLDGLKDRRLVDLPEFNLFAARVGAFIQKATKQDTTAPGASPAPAQGPEASRTDSAAFASGVATGF
jgi:hypothetical protein